MFLFDAATRVEGPVRVGKSRAEYSLGLNGMAVAARVRDTTSFSFCRDRQDASFPPPRESPLRNCIFAALLIFCASFATSNSTQAASGSYVWHHASPIYVGKASPRKTYGRTIHPAGRRTLKRWYATPQKRSTSRRVFRWIRRK